MLKDFFRDVVKYFPAQVIPGIVGFLSIPIITRLFLPQDYGNYSLVMATISMLIILIGWLPMSTIRFYPAYEREERLNNFYENLIKLVFISVLVIVFPFIILLLFLKKYLSIDLYVLSLIGICLFVVTAVFSVFQGFLRAQRRAGWYSGFAIWVSIMGFGLGLVFIILFKFGIEGLIIGMIISILLVLPLLWKNSIGNIFIIKNKINFSLLKEMARYSFPLVVGNLAAWILSLSDRFIIELYRGSHEVGIYSASYNISDRSVMIIVSLFMIASGPILFHIWEKEGVAKSKEFLTNVTRYYLIICIPTVVGLSILIKPISKIMLGEQFFKGYTIVPFITSGIFFLGLQKRFNDSLLLYKKTNFIALSIVSSCLLNVGLNFLFIPRYGYFAAAITTLISYVFLLFLMILFSRRFFVWKFPFKSLAKVIFATSVMGIVVYWLVRSLTSLAFINLILSMCLGAAMYFLILIILREFTVKQVQLLSFLKAVSFKTKKWI